MATNTSNSSIFNPDVQETQDPNYLRLSRPIENLKDYGTVTGELAKGGGALFADVVKVSHELTEENLDDKIHAGVDQIRDQRTADLANTLNYVQGGGKVAVNDSGKAASLLSQPDASSDVQPPKPLQDRIQTAQVLESARQNGKISPTDYIARLNTLAKDIRSQYPGWRDYIDDKIKDQTGMNPANALITSMTNDINTWAENKKSFSDKITAEMLKHNGEPEAAANITMRQQGAMSDEKALQWLYKVDGDKTALGHAKTNWEFNKGSLEDRKLLAGNYADEKIDQLVTNTMASVMAPYGNDPAKITESLKNADPETVLNFKKNLDSKMVQIQLAARNELSIRSRTDPNRSPILDLGDDEFQKRLDNKLSVYKAWSSALGDKDMTTANFWEKLNSANVAKATNDMMRTPMGDSLRDYEILRKNVGDVAASQIASGYLTGTLPADYDAYQAKKKLQRDAGTPDSKTGQVSTLKDSIGDAYNVVMHDPKLQGNPTAQRQRVAQLAEQMIQQIEKIGDSSTPIAQKRRYVQDAFSEKGLGLLAQMELDGTGPNGGKGRYSVFERLQDPKMTDSIKALGGTEWDMYKKWSQSTMQNELLLPEMQTLNKIQGDPNVKLRYDNTNHRFAVDYGKDLNVNLKANYKPDTSAFLDKSFVGITSDANVKYTSQFVNRLNGALDKYSYVVQKDSADPNAHILQTLIELGFDPTISRPDGINKAMIDAMAASSEAKKKLQQELEQKYKKTR